MGQPLEFASERRDLAGPGGASLCIRLPTRRAVGSALRFGAWLMSFLLAIACAAPLHAQQKELDETQSVLEQLKETLEEKEAEKQARPTRWGEPTEVEVSIYVIDIDEINSASQNFSASVYYEVRWMSPLLKHDGPGPKVQPSTSIWTPGFTLVNQQQAWAAFPNYVSIQPSGEVIFRQKVWGWFSQPLQLADFPFDRHVISLHLASTSSLESQMKVNKLKKAFRRETSGISKSFSIPDFEVVKWTAGSRAYRPAEGEIGVAGFILEIELKRKPDYFIWKIILPLCLIVVMSWIPRWLDPKDIGTSVGLSATAFLTLVAYLFAINLLLPRVSYLTRLDVFILLSTLLVFIGLIHTVLSSYFAGLGRLEKVVYANRISRWVYPMLLLMVVALSFGGAGERS